MFEKKTRSLRVGDVYTILKSWPCSWNPTFKNCSLLCGGTAHRKCICIPLARHCVSLIAYRSEVQGGKEKLGNNRKDEWPTTGGKETLLEKQGWDTVGVEGSESNEAAAAVCWECLFNRQRKHWQIGLNVFWESENGGWIYGTLCSSYKQALHEFSHSNHLSHTAQSTCFFFFYIHAGTFPGLIWGSESTERYRKLQAWVKKCFIVLEEAHWVYMISVLYGW